MEREKRHTCWSKRPKESYQQVSTLHLSLYFHSTFHKIAILCFRFRIGDSTGSILSQIISGGLDINLQPDDQSTDFVAVQSFSAPSVAPKTLWNTRLLTFVRSVFLFVLSLLAVGERLVCKMKLRGSRINERMNPFPSRITSKYT